MKEFFIDDHGTRLHAKLELPQGKEKCPLILIVHGITGHMEERHIKAAAEAALDMGIAALRVEMYGHGMSDGQFEDHTLFRWISNILAVADYAASLDFVTDLFITGHSQGGLLSIIAAGMRPDMFKALIPLSPALSIPDQARKGLFLGLKMDPVNLPDEFIFKDKKLRGDCVAVAQMIYAEDLIRKYTGPVLLIHGDEDERVPVEYSIKANELYKNSRLVIIRGDNHGYDHHLDQVLDAYKKFLGEF